MGNLIVSADGSPVTSRSPASQQPNSQPKSQQAQETSLDVALDEGEQRKNLAELMSLLLGGAAPVPDAERAVYDRKAYKLKNARDGKFLFTAQDVFMICAQEAFAARDAYERYAKEIAGGRSDITAAQNAVGFDASIGMLGNIMAQLQGGFDVENIRVLGYTTDEATREQILKNCIAGREWYDGHLLESVADEGGTLADMLAGTTKEAVKSHHSKTERPDMLAGIDQDKLGADELPERPEH